MPLIIERVSLSELGGSGIFNSMSATAIIFITTADDAIWLIPFVVSGRRFSKRSRALHAFVFVVSLQIVVGVCAIGTTLFGDVAGAQAAIAFGLPLDLMSKLMATALAWAVVTYLYVRKCLRQRRRAQQKNNNANMNMNNQIEDKDADNTNNLYIPRETETFTNMHQTDVKTVSLPHDVNNNNNNNSNNNNNTTTTTKTHTNRSQREPASPWTVLMLGFAGALDEMTYFPTLILSRRFSGLELATGALVATSAIVVVMVYFLAQCKPMLDFFDSIPLYIIVGVFAIFMTIETTEEFLAFRDMDT